MRSYYKKGDYNVQCDICGVLKKRSECRKTWENYIACINTCWYPKHPNDFPPPKPRNDPRPVRDARPAPAVGPIIFNIRNWENINTMWEDLTFDPAHKWENLT